MAQPSNDPRAIFAIDHFVHRCALSAGMLAGALVWMRSSSRPAWEKTRRLSRLALPAPDVAWRELDPVANEAGALIVDQGEPL